jgi:hypothetical protein
MFSTDEETWINAEVITDIIFQHTRRVSRVEQKVAAIPEHMSSTPVFSEVPVTRSLVLCVRFVDRCLSFCPFSIGHCVVGLSNSSYKPVTNTAWVRTRLCKLQNMVHSTRSRKG